MRVNWPFPPSPTVPSVVPGGLDGRDRGAELQVLHPHQNPGQEVHQYRPAVPVRARVVPVDHPHLDLDRADRRVAEQPRPGAHVQAVRGRTAVRVDHPDDQMVAAPGRGQPGPQLPVGGVQRVPLPGAGVGEAPGHHVHHGVPPGPAGHDGAGLILAGVVDDPDMRLGQRPPQVVERGPDHLLFVQRGDEQVPAQGPGVSRRLGAAPGVRHRDDQHVDDERGAHHQADRLGERDGDRACAAHERRRRCRGSRAALNSRPRREATIAVSKTRLRPMPTMLTREPSTRWPTW